MNSILLNAILSMDSYNRGYNSGIDFSIKDQNGNITNASDTAGTKIGEVTVYRNLGNIAAQNIGFYGIAYELSGGEIIISYRGTDDVDGFPNPLTDMDVQHGWTLGAGLTSSQQGQMAIELYNDVAGSGNALTANISLVGHSLGGGLAEYVGNDNRPERFPGRRVA